MIQLEKLLNEMIDANEAKKTKLSHNYLKLNILGLIENDYPSKIEDALKEIENLRNWLLDEKKKGYNMIDIYASSYGDQTIESVKEY